MLVLKVVLLRAMYETGLQNQNVSMTHLLFFEKSATYIALLLFVAHKVLF